MSDRHPLNKLSSLLFYELLEMRAKIKERILKRLEDENSSTDDILAMVESLLQLNEIVDKEVKGRQIAMSRYEFFKDYRIKK